MIDLNKPSQLFKILISLITILPFHLILLGSLFSGNIRNNLFNLFKTLLDNGIIRKSNSPYASAVVIVRKKDKSLRLCVDYRELNKRPRGHIAHLSNWLEKRTYQIRTENLIRGGA